LQTIDYLRKDEGAGALMVFPSWFWAKDSASFENKTQLFVWSRRRGRAKTLYKRPPQGKKTSKIKSKE
jgi:hypothetical protein